MPRLQTMCGVPRCDHKAYCLGLCGSHYNSFLKERLKGTSRYERYIVRERRKKGSPRVQHSGIVVSVCHCGDVFVEGVGCGRCRYESRQIIRRGANAGMVA